MTVISSEKIHQRFEKTPDYFSGKRSHLIEMIPPSCKKVLDVGCGSGEVWKGFPFDVSGIEINEAAAEKARQNLQEVKCVDLDKETPLTFGNGPFDCILFADVLEHLYDPWGVLINFSKILKAEGLVLVSLPNIRHYRVIRSLLFKAEFPYQESGVLDIDHVRFFTFKEMQRLLLNTGFEIVEIRKNRNASAKYKILNTILFGLLDDFLTEQYYILARRTAKTSAN